MATNVHHTLASFRARYPHVPQDAATDALVQGVLDEAAARTPVDVWGDYALEGHGSLACHKLGAEPYGRDARLQSDDGQTTYGKQRADLETLLGAAVTPRTS